MICNHIQYDIESFSSESLHERGVIVSFSMDVVHTVTELVGSFSSVKEGYGVAITKESACDEIPQKTCPTEDENVHDFI